MLTRRQRWIFAGATLSGAVVPLSLWVAARFRGQLFTDAERITPRPVAIVLGCLAHPSGRPSLHLEDRLVAALTLYRAQRVSQIIVSGNAAAVTDEVAVMSRWLVDRGVPAEHIVSDDLGVRTRATMHNAANRFHVRRAIVCTHRYHLPRSLYLAQGFGIDAVGLVADRERLERPLMTHAREFGARAMAVLDCRLGTRRR